MSKNVISIIIISFSVISLVLSLLGFLIIFAAGALAASTTDPSAAEGYGFIAVVGVLFLIAAVVIGLVPWIGGLIRAAKMHTWGWFSVVLLLGSLGALLYSIVALVQPPAMTQGRYPVS